MRKEEYTDHESSHNSAPACRIHTNSLQADKLQALIKAANVEVEPIWTSIFAKVRFFTDPAVAT